VEAKLKANGAPGALGVDGGERMRDRARDHAARAARPRWSRPRRW
jgi:hypothetical protein